MIATGKLDDETRRGLKKELRAIKESKKRKKSRRNRSRSRSRSPEANFSSESEDNKLPTYIEQEYNDSRKDNIFKNDMEDKEQTGALMFDPEESEHSKIEEKVSYPKGTVFKLKNVSIELVLKKKGKITTKGCLFSDEDYKKILNELVDPGFSTVSIRK